MPNETLADLAHAIRSLPSYQGWRFTYEYPGYFCFTHPASDRTIWATPDNHREGEIDIQIEVGDGYHEDPPIGDPEFPSDGRTAERSMEIVRPVLDHYQPAPLKIEVCSICKRPTHPNDSDDLDRCTTCQPKES